MSVPETIRARIREAGPITFAEFMELALYGPGGFYDEPPVGEGGHFVTSPHVHPAFARLLARALAQLWEDIGGDGPPNIIEVGAGDGTLGAQLLKAMPRASYAAIERGAGARRQLAARGFAAFTDIAEIGDDDTALLVANELLDNLPFHRVRMTGSGLVELLITVEDDRFVEVEARCPDDISAAAPALQPGEEAAVSLEALRFTEHVERVLDRGYVILIDYERAPGEPRGGIHGYRGQQLVRDVLAHPGSADITAGVDLNAVTGRAGELGLEAFDPITQRDALLSLGFHELMSEERTNQAELLDQGSAREAVLAWSRRNAAQMLVDPGGLGDLRWLVLATSGLPEPLFLTPGRRLP